MSRLFPAFTLPALVSLATVTLGAASLGSGCKGRDNLTPITTDELKKGAQPPPAPPAPAPARPAEPVPSGAKAWVEVPDLGVKVETPAGWSFSVPQPGYYTVKGSGQDGFVQVNRATGVPSSPDEAATARCIGPGARTLVKEKTASGAIFVVCETELQGNKTRSINAWLQKAGAPAAAHCTITTDRHWGTLEPVCRSLSAL